MSIMFNEICINEEMLPIYIYIYIYMCVCVCVCVFERKTFVILTKKAVLKEKSENITSSYLIFEKIEINKNVLKT